MIIKPDRRILTPAQIEHQRAMRALKRRRRPGGPRFAFSGTFDQISFRWRDDDGNETGATWLENINTDHTITISADTKIRVRIEVELTGDDFANFEEIWYYDKNGLNSWAPIPASSTSGVEYTTSVEYADGTDTTSQLAQGSGSFITNNDGLIEGTNTGDNQRPDYTATDRCEFEMCMQVINADVSNNDYFDFAIWEVGHGVLESYSQIPRLTISKAAAAGQPFYTRDSYTMPGFCTGNQV